jgi:predicted nuclease of predicted toxin-antitoxin system
VIKLILDQGLPRSAASILRQLGFDAIHVGDVNLSRAEDQHLLAFARSENRVCCTLDADFHRYLALEGTATPSVIRIRIEGLKGNDLAALLADIAKTLEQELASGSAISVTRKSVRVRRLPIGRKPE